MGENAVEARPAEGPAQRIILPLSDAARASLQAVRAAQESALRRARRDTRRARTWTAGVVAGLGLAVLVLGPRVRVGRHEKAASLVSRAETARTAETAIGALGVKSLEPSAAQAAAVAPSASGADPRERAATTSAAVTGSAQIAPSTTAAADVPGSATATGTGTPDTAAEGSCAQSFSQHRWRLAIEACTAAFQARPTDARLALKIAQANHARARLPEASVWANRALAVDPTLAEAFVIVAHAETQAGHPGATVEAYRRYLTLAPRGWHAAEARAAVRAHARDKDAHARRGGRRPTTVTAGPADSAPEPG